MKVLQIYARCFLCFAVATGYCRATAQTRTGELVRHITAVLDSSYTYIQSDIKRQTDMSLRYDSLFQLLVNTTGLVAAQTGEENTIENKILAIAKYKAQNQLLFSEVEQKYVFGLDNSRQIAPSAPPLMPAFRVEKYRLVWEYFLLKPPAADMSPGYEQRAADAVAAIGNQASLITLEKLYGYSTKTKDAPDYPVVNRQKQLLLTIGKMPSEAAALSLTRIIRLPVQRPEDLKKMEWSPRVFVKDMLAGRQHLKTIAGWKTVINQVEKKRTIDAATRQLLKEIKND